MAIISIEIRALRSADCGQMPALYRAAWQHTYAGIIPGLALEQLITRHGRDWWERAASQRNVVVLDFDGVLAGYAHFGPSRAGSTGRQGEVYEIYLRPEYQGTGLGRRLFHECRRCLSEMGFIGLVIWALAENDVARRFYRAMRGREVARSCQTIGGKALPMVAYAWR